MKTKAVIFDMDGVLFDTQKIYIETWEYAANEMGIENIHDAAYDCIGRNRNNIEQYLKNKFGLEFNVDEFYSRKDVWFDRIISHRGVPIKKGAREILKFLKDSDIKTALATSTGQKRAYSHLYEAGLFDMFDIKVTGNMVANSKPAPDIYALACKLLKESPKSCYAVEDSYNGIYSAYSCGLKTVMVPDMLMPNEETDKLCTMVCSSLLDFKKYLKAEFEQHR